MSLELLTGTIMIKKNMSLMAIRLCYRSLVSGKIPPVN